MWWLSPRRSGGEQAFPAGEQHAQRYRDMRNLGIFWKEYSWIIKQDKEGEEGHFSLRNKGGKA